MLPTNLLDEPIYRLNAAFLTCVDASMDLINIKHSTLRTKGRVGPQTDTLFVQGS